MFGLSICDYDTGAHVRTATLKDIENAITAARERSQPYFTEEVEQDGVKVVRRYALQEEAPPA
ncbi:MAG: hypothetical protein H0X38_10505 [Planctomycetes bacterium]|nr:hypothetical protein [Planctomycetota bacterium]